MCFSEEWRLKLPKYIPIELLRDPYVCKLLIWYSYKAKKLEGLKSKDISAKIGMSEDMFLMAFQRIKKFYKSESKNLDPLQVLYKEVIEYLNEKTSNNLNWMSPYTQGLIRSRSLEGADIDDFKQCIDNMCKEWLNDPEMVKHLVPNTLFSAKFDGYVNRPKVVDSSEQLQKSQSDFRKQFLEKYGVNKTDSESQTKFSI
jgi:uncharacterized phage protein (TIGR02220 family)